MVLPDILKQRDFYRYRCAQAIPFVRGELPIVGKMGPLTIKGYGNLVFIITCLLGLMGFIGCTLFLRFCLGYIGLHFLPPVLWLPMGVGLSLYIGYCCQRKFKSYCVVSPASMDRYFKRLKLRPPINLLLIKLPRLSLAGVQLQAAKLWHHQVIQDKKPSLLYLGRSTGVCATLWHGAGLAPDQDIVLPCLALTRNLLVLGGIGSGKTTGVMLPLLLQCMDQDAGGLLFDIKGDLKAAVTQFSTVTHKQTEWIGPSYGQLNLLTGLTPEIAASFLKSVFLLHQGGHTDGFWVDTATELCRNTLGILSFIPDHYNLYELYGYLFHTDTRERLNGLIFALQETLNEAQSRLLNSYLHYYQDIFRNFDIKVQSGVRATVAQVLSPFNHPDLIDAFCLSGGEMIDMTSILAGKLLCVDLPLSRWGMGAKVVYTLIKLRFFNLMQSRHLHPQLNQTRPVIFLCDEYQEIVSANPDGLSDLSFWDKSRSSHTIGLISAQSVSSFYAAVGRREVVHALLQNFRHKLCFCTEDPDTIEFLQKMMGQAAVKRVTEGHQGTSITEVREWVITAQLFRKLTPHQALAILSLDGLSWDDVIEVMPIYQKRVWSSCDEMNRSVR